MADEETTEILLRLPAKLADSIKELAKRESRTNTAQIILLLEAGLEKAKK